MGRTNLKYISSGEPFSISFGIDEEKVVGCFGDDEFSGTNLSWELQKTENGYRIAETLKDYPSIVRSPEGYLKVIPDTIKHIEIHTNNHKEAISKMIDFIVNKYSDDGMDSYPVDAKELDCNLRKVFAA